MNRIPGPRFHHHLRSAVTTLSLFVALITVSLIFGADEERISEQQIKTQKADDAEKSTSPDQSHRVSLAVAQDRARLMHRIYTTTLEVMHHRYFHADRAVVPARAMEDVFSNLERETGSRANWISVNLRAMSINHDPETNFEKQAARELSQGKPEFEVVEDGLYRRATPIPLHGGCISCHAGFSPQQSKKQNLAGLIISIPVTPGATLLP